MRRLMVGCLAAATVAATGCTQTQAHEAGPAVHRSFAVGSFHRIEVAGPYSVDVRTGGSPSVAAEGPQSGIDHMVVEVSDDTLKIHPREDRGLFHFGTWDDKVTVHVTSSPLSAASVAGSGGVRVDKVEGNAFEGSLAGSGELDLDQAAVQTLKLSLAGSGGIHARSGQASQANFTLTGSGNIHAGDVRVQTASLSITGSGNIDAQASRTADVSIMGSGGATVTGGAKCSVSKMGSGSANCS